MVSLNNGSTLYRRSEWTKSWIDFILSKEPEYRHDCWYEQRIMQHFWEQPQWKEKICVLPQNSINSYSYSLYPPWNGGTPGDWRSGDLVLSFPGTNMNQRVGLVTEAIKNKVIR